MRRTVIVPGVVAVLLAAHGSVAQPQDPKQAFAAAIGQFTAALEGRFGDDATQAERALATLDTSLAAWDAAVQRVEGSIAEELKQAPPEAVPRLHIAAALALAERGRIDDALAHLNQAVARAPRDVDARTVLGLVHSQLTGRMTDAQNALRVAVAVDPGAPLQRYLLAKLLADQGALDEAVSVGRPLHADTHDADAPERAPFLRIHLIPERPGVEPYFPPARYAEAMALLAQGRYQESLAALRSAMAGDPLFSAPLPVRADVQLAGEALRDGDTASALDALDRVRQAAPGWGQVHRLRGVALVADERRDEAIVAFTETLRLDPLDDRSHLALADAYAAQQRYDDAAAALDAAISRLPAAPGLRHARARVRQRQGLYPEALADFEQALSLKPSLPLLGRNSVHATVGTLRRARQEFAEATAAFARRVDLVPNDAQAHRDLGDVHFRQGLNDLAWTEFAMAEALAPRDLVTQAALAQLHLRAGRHAAAAAAARRIIRRAPADAQAHFVLGTALMRLDQPEDAARALDTFARLDAAEAEARSRDLELAALRREAEVAAGEGNHTNAVAALTTVVEREPTSAAAHVALGAALIRAGRGAEAVDRLQTAAGLGADADVYRHLADAYALAGNADMSARARDVYLRIRRDRLRQAQQP